MKKSRFKDFIEMKELSTKMIDAIYLGAILTQESQKALFTAVSSVIHVPVSWKKFCHHMTIQFKPTSLPTLGEDVSMVVTSLFADAKGIAVKVEPVGVQMPTGQVPHVTVATAPGVAPVYSNELIKEQGMKMPNHLTLHAFIGAKTRSGIMPERFDTALENF